jgi:Tol biopolymer transport system component
MCYPIEAIISCFKKIRTIMRKIVLTSLIILILVGLSCHKDNPSDGSKPPCGGIDPGIVPEPPYNSPIWHPSGQFIGFNHTPLKRITYPYGEQCWGEQEFDYDSTGFWLINPDGTNMRRIFPYTLQTPAWSPDGEWIAFVLGAQIFKMKFTGSAFDTLTLTQLTSAGRNFFPAWSPDGRWIAYDRSLADASGPGGIWRMKSDGTSKEALFGGAYPAWHPNNQNLIGVIGTSPTSTWTKFVRYELSKSRVIDTLSAVVGNDNRHPLYSPDGTKIAFWSSGTIWLMDTTGSNQYQLTTQSVDVSFGLPFSWSPNGTNIAYTVYQSDNWGYENGTIWTVDVTTGVKHQLTFTPKSID